jgi:hypothetical protein
MKWVLSPNIGLCSKKNYMRTLKIREFEIPVSAMPEVANILSESELTNSITGTDDDQEIIFVEVSYDKDDEDERSAIHAIDDVIADHEYDEDDSDDHDEN